MSQARPLLAFYGDDFTGSTDALEVAAFAGLRSALFLRRPSADVLKHFTDLQVIGFAGTSRGMSPAEMDAHLASDLRYLAMLDVPLIHYKVCSTFDSSPELGSIGRVIQLAQRYFGSAPIPIVGGTPSLQRYCMFGHLFARSGTDGQVYRIDRHPIMSVHPATPMGESDLATHIGKQADVKIAKLIFPSLEEGADAARGCFNQLIADSPDAVLIDAANFEQLTRVGQLLDEYAKQ